MFNTTKPDAEGVSVIVVTSDALDQESLSLVAGQVASDLYPDRTFGPVLWVEECADGYEVIVADMGPSGGRHD